jgi:hypothetical protein
VDKRPLSDAIGLTVTHKRLGPCRIDAIVAEPDYKVKVNILSSNEEKVVIFSPQFFEGIDDFEAVDVAVKPRRPKKKVHRLVDMNKYRNHPLVKEIEAKEKGYSPRELYSTDIEEPDDDPILDVEDDE